MNELNIDKTHWKKYRFDEIVQNISERVEPSQTDLDLYVGLEHIDPDTLHLSRHGHPSDVEGTKLRFYKGDIIFGRRRAYQRKTALATADGICSAHAMVVRAKEDIVDPMFLPFLFHSKNFIDMAITISVGGLSPTINWKDIAKQEILLPPKTEQKRLAELLWAADEMVEKEKREIELLREHIQIYINDNCNIAGQPKISFSDLVEVNPITRFNEKEVSLITMPDVSEEGEITHHEKVTPSDYKGKGLTPFQENDILFAKITPCMENGKGTIARGLFNCFGLGSSEFHVLRPKTASDLYFCYYLTMSKRFRKLAEKQMTGSAGQKRVQVEFFDFYKLHAPSKEDREIIGGKLYEIDCSIAALKQQITLSLQVKQELINNIYPIWIKVPSNT